MIVRAKISNFSTIALKGLFYAYLTLTPPKVFHVPL